MGQSHPAVTVSGTVWPLAFCWLLSETVALVLVQFVLLFPPSPSMTCDHWLPDPRGTPFERGVWSCDPPHDLDPAHCGPLGYSLGNVLMETTRLGRHHSDLLWVSYFTARGPGKEHRANKPLPPRRAWERSKGDATCLTISQNHGNPSRISSGFRITIQNHFLLESVG